jgi:5-methylcytosine-specific restriction endonuclease McrA
MIRVERGRLSLPRWFSRNAKTALERARKLRKHRLLKNGDFDRHVYGSREMKKALWLMQRKKCCWCEQWLGYRAQDVDHFRPKTKARRSDSESGEGYWWLAYTEDNLFFSCKACNLAKGDWFPLRQGSRPLRAGEHPGTRREKPLLIDPSADPARHLCFIKEDRAWRLTVRDRSPLGRTTLRRVQLDRDELDELRDDWVKDRLRPVRRRFEQARRGSDRKAARTDALQLCAPKSAFSLLARCYFIEHGVIQQDDLA